MQSERTLLALRIARLLERIPGIEDDEFRAESTKYACVLMSGLLEATCRDVMTRFAAKRGSKELVRVAETVVGRFQNPSTGKIVDLLSVFDPDKATAWRLSIDDEQADAIDSIVNNRHQIAHGRQSGLSFGVLLRYYNKAKSAVDLIEQSFPRSDY